MKTNNRFVFAAVFLLSIATQANAALVDRGGGLIYDNVFNITWLADTNYAMTSGYDADGLMNWTDAVTWVGDLSYGGYTDWYLPYGGGCSGYNCTDSQMGHLFYSDLGGVAGQSITTSHNSNYNLFQNFQHDYTYYWSGSEQISGGSNYFAWAFSFGYGTQYWSSKPGGMYALAVRDGDVAAVPIPAAFWLFGSGLIGLFGFMRRR